MYLRITISILFCMDWMNNNQTLGTHITTAVLVAASEQPNISFMLLASVKISSTSNLLRQRLQGCKVQLALSCSEN